MRAAVKTTTSERMRTWTGPAILSHGFRPFFLLAGMWAAFSMVLWIAQLSGHDVLATVLDPVSWHAHEMLFGYLGAVLAGFLMTAVPNWTGRMPIVGWPLAGLVFLWLAGRVAVALLGNAPIATMVVDLAFPFALVLAMGREIIVGRNWRNLSVLALIGMFALANLLFHLAALRGDHAASGIGFRFGLAVAVLLISFVGGRIVPSFTRNWLKQRGSSVLPAQFSPADWTVLLFGAAFLSLWVLWPLHRVTGFGLLLAGLGHFWRLSRWSGHLSSPEPLVWVLHAGYAFVPAGFVMTGAAAFGWIPQAAAQHVWMAGAIGLMTLAVMTRATLGHSGLPLTATRATAAIYFALIGAVVARLAYGFWPGTPGLLHIAAGLWIASFTGFVLVFGPVLVRPRTRKS